jgi:NADH:ubiquinone reductase (H+-translocating)
MAWRQRIVIVGGGFAGIEAARSLSDERVDVLLLDRTNHHLFQPLLYQVATCALSPADIAFPIRHIFASQPNVEVLFTEVTSVNLQARRVETKSGPIDYHFLLLAAGAETNFYGRDDWAQAAPGLKTLDEALQIRRKVLLALELAEQETEPARRRELLTFCVIGGGPTGVELAGALSELSRSLVKRDFRHIASEEISVRLVEGGPGVLKAFAPSLQASALKQLEKLGVVVHTGSRVVGLTSDALTIRDADNQEHLIPAATILWAAGVRASPLAQSLGVPLDKMGRIIVDRALNVPGYDEVFAIGDIAACEDAKGVSVPGVAPAAMQMGRFVAQQIIRRLQGLSVQPFVYKNKGNLATIGRSAAVAEFGNARLSGFPAWLLWLLIHVAFLVGFRNRFIVVTQWIWQYLTSRGGARIITGNTGQEFQWPSQPRRLGRRKAGAPGSEKDEAASAAARAGE